MECTECHPHLMCMCNCVFLLLHVAKVPTGSGILSEKCDNEQHMLESAQSTEAKEKTLTFMMMDIY